MQLNKILYFALGPIGAAALSFITLPVLAWVFTPEDVGSAALLQITVTLAFTVFGLALEQAYVREFYEFPDRARLLRTTFGPGILLLLFATVLAHASDVNVSRLMLGIDSALLGGLIVASVYANFITTYALLTLRMQERALAYSLVTLASKAMLLVLVLVCAAGGFDRSLEVLFSLHAAAMGIAMVAAVWLSRREWRACLRARFDPDAFVQLLRFSTPLLIAGIAYWALASVDRIAIRAWSSIEQLGYYSVALSFAGVALIAQNVFTTVWTPTIYRWDVEGIVMGRFQKVVDSVLITVVLLYALIGMSSWLVSYLLPADYNLVQHIMVACMGGPLFYMLSEATGVGISLERRTLFAMLVPVIALAVGGAAYYVLVPAYGAAGAAVATNLSFLVFLFFRTELSARLWKRFPRGRLYGFATACSAVAGMQALLQVAYREWIFLAWAVLATAVLIRYRERFTDLPRFALAYLVKRA